MINRTGKYSDFDVCKSLYSHSMDISYKYIIMVPSWSVARINSEHPRDYCWLYQLDCVVGLSCKWYVFIDCLVIKLMILLICDRMLQRLMLCPKCHQFYASGNWVLYSHRLTSGQPSLAMEASSRTLSSISNSLLSTSLDTPPGVHVNATVDN